MLLIKIFNFKLKQMRITINIFHDVLVIEINIITLFISSPLKLTKFPTMNVLLLPRKA
jgi:hypothetical protein